MKAVRRVLLLYGLILTFSCHAQEENALIQHKGKKYIDLKIKSLDTYNSRLQHQQQHLINKLKRRETRFGNKLQKTDSIAYARYKQQAVSYDSISRMQPDSSTLSKVPKRKNAFIDSLKGVEIFVLNKGLPSSQAALPQISQEQSQLNYHNYINELITQRTNYLKSLSASPNSNLPGITGIEKEVFYAKAKMNVYKEMEEDPTKAEDKALEYLQGTEGFDKTMNSAMAGPNSMQGATNAADLEKMGFQTKSMLEAGLQQKFGSSLGSVAQQMNSQVGHWQDKTQGITNAINSAKQTKQSLQQVRNINKPSFKINPMRGMPFFRRIEKTYNWQTTRPTIDGKPAMFGLSAMAGYKQTPKLSYGLGIATSIGLGQNWNNVRLTFQGLGLRTYSAWQWQYGIGAYAGYERMYKQAVFTNSTGNSTDITPTVHNTSTYTESVLIGLTKSYHMNDKWNGQLQVLYDLWWQQEGLGSPIVLRFATVKK